MLSGKIGVCGGELGKTQCLRLVYAVGETPSEMAFLQSLPCLLCGMWEAGHK